MASGQHMLAYRELIKLGYSPPQAAGIVGNLIQESSLNPTAVGDQGSAFGIAQWRGGRLSGLKDFAGRQGGDFRDINTQLRYLDHELKGPESFAGRQLQMAKTPEEATAAFMHFERPKGYTRQNPTAGHGWNNRVAAARNVFGGSGTDTLTGSTGTQEQLMATPMQNAPGGLGGLGGFLGGRGFGDVMQAVGMSMMSSPRSNWLQNVGEYLPALQLASEKRQKTKAEQDAIASTLMKADPNLSEEDARKVANSPKAAQLAMDQIAARQQAEANTAFQGRIGGIAGGGGAAAPAGGMMPQMARTGTQPSVGGREAGTGAIARPKGTRPPQAPQAPAGTGAGDRRVEALLRRRQAIVDTITQAGSKVSKEVVDRAELQIGQIDKMLERVLPDVEPGFLGFKKGSDAEADAIALRQNHPELTDQQISGHVAGLYRIDPKGGGMIHGGTGEAIISDRAEMERLAAGEGVPGMQEQPERQRQGGTLWDATSEATGIVPSLGRGFDATFGQAAGMAGVDFAQAPKMVAAKQRYDAFSKSLREALLINARGAVWEQQLIQNLADPGAFTRPGAMEQKLVELRDNMVMGIREAAATAADPNATSEERGIARRQIRTLTSAIERMGVPAGARSALDEDEPQAPAQPGSKRGKTSSGLEWSVD